MISRETALDIHNALIEQSGGSKGLRDEALLLSALARPFATFDQQYLYPSPAEKAAAILESVIINHPFIDGNKRIAYFLMRLILLESDLDIYASEDEKYDFTIAASKGEIRIDDITVWIREKLILLHQ
jgi:death-on-curing protein